MNSVIRVCHMTSVHPGNDVRIFHKMCVSLAAAGYDTWLVAPGESHEEKGVQVVGVGAKPSSRLKRMTQMARRVYVKALELDADIYHFHDPELLPWGLRLKKKGKKVIYDSHEDYVVNIKEKTWIPFLFRRFVAWLFQSYEKHVLQQLDHIIGVTPRLCERLKKSNGTTMICNFPMVPPVLSELPTFQERRIVFAGGIVEQWCHELIIRALEKIDHVQYTLCGRAEEKYLARLKTLPEWKKVNYLGQIPFTEVPRVMAQSNIGMVILRYPQNGDLSGTLGNTKLFECMLAGLPVICTDFTLWKEILGQYHCGICVAPNDQEQIIQAINELMDHPDQARVMGQNGRRAVLEQYNWGEEEKKLLSLYQDIGKMRK